MEIEVFPRKVLGKFLIFFYFLLFANVAGLVFRFYFGLESYTFTFLFNFDGEKNIPTFYSALALIISSALLGLIASNRKRYGASYLSWLGLSVIFLFLSIDELVSLHELLINPVRTSLNTSGFFFYAWIIPYGAAVLIFLVAYSRFLLELPRRIMKLFIASGAVFVAGAIGMEGLGGWYMDLHGTRDMVYAIVYTCEESMEMLGIMMFIYTLLLYIGNQGKSFSIYIDMKK